MRTSTLPPFINTFVGHLSKNACLSERPVFAKHVLLYLENTGGCGMIKVILLLVCHSTGSDRHVYRIILTSGYGNKGRNTNTNTRASLMNTYCTLLTITNIQVIVQKLQEDGLFTLSSIMLALFIV